MLVNICLALIASGITYNLALGIMGEKRPLKEIAGVTIIIALGLIVSKVLLKATPPVHIMIYIAILWGCLYWINRFDWLSSLITSTISILIIVFSSLLISDPILMRSGVNLSAKPNQIDWVYINLVEFSPQIIVLIIIKMFKISLKKFEMTRE